MVLSASGCLLQTTCASKTMYKWTYVQADACTTKPMYKRIHVQVSPHTNWPTCKWTHIQVDPCTSGSMYKQAHVQVSPCTSWPMCTWTNIQVDPHVSLGSLFHMACAKIEISSLPKPKLHSAVYSTFCLYSSHLSVNIWAVSMTWLLWILLPWTSECSYLFKIFILILLDIFPEVGFLHHPVYLFLLF